MVKSFKTNILTWLKTKTYIKTEIDNLLNRKSDTNHNHNSTYSLLNHQHTGLNGKADAVSNSAGQQSVAGYRKVFRLKITKPYFDSPVSFEFIQRNNRQTARVHILFNSSANSTDPPLQYFTYQGIVKTPFYLYRESAGTWVFITKEQSTYETVNVRFLPLSSNIKNGCTITPLDEYLADLPTDNIHVGSMITATSTQTGYMDHRDKIKLDGIDDGANKTVVDSSLSSSSTNPVQNKVVNNALNGKANSSHNHSISNITNLQSALDNKSETGHTHDDRYYTETEMNTKLNNKADNANLIIQKDGEIKIVSHAGIVITSWWTQHITCNKDTWVNFIDSNYTNTSGATIYGAVPIVGGGNAKLRIKNNSEIIEINTPIANPMLQAGQLVYFHY